MSLDEPSSFSAEEAAGAGAELTGADALAPQAEPPAEEEEEAAIVTSQEGKGETSAQPSEEVAGEAVSPELLRDSGSARSPAAEQAEGQDQQPPRPQSVGSAKAATAADDGGGAAADAGAIPAERLRLEHSALMNDLGTLKAKFMLTFQTLRSILCLGSNATWADMLEHCEQLVQVTQSVQGNLGAAPPVACPPDEELQQAELECEQLEEKLEAQTAHIGRLRELLQKQQGLLDMTAQQFETQHEQSELQKQRLAALERRDFQQQETIAAQEGRLRELSSRCESLQRQVQAWQGAAAKQNTLAADQAARIAELQEELTSTQNSLASLSAESQEFRAEGEQQSSEAKAELERQRQEISELEAALYQQGGLVERMTEQLQVFEAADRRRYSYRPSSKSTPQGGFIEEDSGLSSEQSSVCSTARASARGPRPGDLGDIAGSPPPTACRASSGQVITPRTQGKAALATSASAPAAATAPLSAMTEEERIKFLAHFPMASRTERHLRNRLEDRRRVKPAVAK